MDSTRELVLALPGPPADKHPPTMQRAVPWEGGPQDRTQLKLMKTTGPTPPEDTSLIVPGHDRLKSWDSLHNSWAAVFCPK